jgi:hypothetical protein
VIAVARTAALAGALCLANGITLAQDAAPRLTVELNDVSSGAGPCKAVFVVNNGLGTPLGKLTMRLVAFDKQGRALRFVALDAGAMPERKTRVFRFDLTEQSCDDLGRVVLDDLPACEGAGLEPAACLKALAVSSRTALDLAY